MFLFKFFFEEQATINNKGNKNNKFKRFFIIS
jgi:hypothetical protein